MKYKTRTFRTHTPTLWLALFAALLLTTMPALADPDRSVYVTGEGEVTAWPDYIRIDLNISAEAKSSNDAKNRVDIATNKVLAAAKQLGIAHTDIKAANITSQPVYEWNNNKRTITAEQVSRSVQLTLRDLPQFTPLTHLLIQASDVSIVSTKSGFNDAAALIMEATDLALRQARKKAERMAITLDQRLGKVISIEEQGGSIAAPAYAESGTLNLKMQNAPTPAPIVLQAEIISSRVAVRFELR